MKLDDALKIVAAGGALVYGVLFLGYRAFYSSLGIQPESVGVNYGFILIRSIGFILLMAAIAGATILLWWINTQYESGPWTTGDTLRFVGSALIGLVLGIYVGFVQPPSLPDHLAFAMGFAPLLFAAVTGLLYKTYPTLSRLSIAIFTVALAVVLPGAAVITRGTDMAHSALEGDPVVPFEIFGIPVLDIDVEEVDVSWLGSASDQPELFATQGVDGTIHGSLIGVGSGSVVLAVAIDDERRVITFPAGSVTLRMADD